ncbi:MAG: hypothetical protein C4576_04470 [Desulfobacteraceae bacterium]|nr:MAG: hypothetical protein C4576_04470 [Desulfobacteraceae bacterium]
MFEGGVRLLRALYGNSNFYAGTSIMAISRELNCLRSLSQVRKENPYKSFPNSGNPVPKYGKLFHPGRANLFLLETM